MRGLSEVFDLSVCNGVLRREYQVRVRAAYDGEWGWVGKMAMTRWELGVTGRCMEDADVQQG